MKRQIMQTLIRLLLMSNRSGSALFVWTNLSQYLSLYNLMVCEFVNLYLYHRCRANGEPSPSSEKNCAIMNLKISENHTWRSIDCEMYTMAPFGICEFDISSANEVYRDNGKILDGCPPDQSLESTLNPVDSTSFKMNAHLTHNVEPTLNLSYFSVMTVTQC